jgi:hypothetical protein
MIKTEQKESPPKGESYVLNATEISDLLCGIPQYDHLSINFSFSNTEYYRNAKKGIHTNDVSVLKISYMKRGGVFFRRNELRSGTLPSVFWSIRQNAISSKLRQPVKRTICNHLREEMRRLCLDTAGFDRCQTRSIEIAFNFNKKAVLLKDIQDDNEHLIKETCIAEQLT